MEHVLLQIRVPKRLRDTLTLVAAARGTSVAEWARAILDENATEEYGHLQAGMAEQFQKKAQAIEKLTIVEQK